MSPAYLHGLAESIVQTLAVTGNWWDENFEIRLGKIISNRKGFSILVWIYYDGEILGQEHGQGKTPIEALESILKGYQQNL